MKTRAISNVGRCGVALLVIACFVVPVFAQAADEAAGEQAAVRPLDDTEWTRIDTAVEKSLRWLASQQQEDGSFPSIPTGQPGVTSLAMMAYLAHGHLPDAGPYGEHLAKALKFILECQKPSGIIAQQYPPGARITRRVSQEVGVTSAYNHAISALVVSELYGMGEMQDSREMQQAITKALAATLEMQRWPKEEAADRGGWRYVNDFDRWDSDVSITGWQLMFLRSARNGGFDVPKQAIDDAVAYIRRAFSPEYGTFEYIISDADTRSRAMAGAGILALAHAGYHDSPEAKQAGEWVLRQHFENYNVIETFGQQPYAHDRYHYAVFNSCQGMYQLGGRYWDEFFPKMARTLINNQHAEGSWDTDSHMFDSKYGNAYTTALMTIALGAPNQLLPIFQR